jgi:thermitase
MDSITIPLRADEQGVRPRPESAPMCQPAPPLAPPFGRRLLAALVVCALQLCCITTLPAQNRPDPVLASSTWRGQQVVAGELLVQFRPGTSAAQQQERNATMGCPRLASVTDSLVRVALPAGADIDDFVARYQAAGEVAFAQPNVLHRPVPATAEPLDPAAPIASAAALDAPGVLPLDPKWPSQWNMLKVRAPEAWAAYTGDPSAVVAVIDTGVDVTHPDLVNHFAWGLDTFAGDAIPDDTAGHGSHCCGVAAAETNNGVGVAGAAWNGRYASYRCGNSTFATAPLVAAIHDAVAKGALVLSMSWGSSYNDPAIRNALQDAADAGCVLVAAAGNDGVSTKFYPAAHDFVIAVAASTSSDARASFSNYGAWVDLAAPGQAIFSTYKGGGYTTMNGTSMACPLVAGAADLLYARLGGVRSPANAALVRAALEGSAVDVGPWVAHGRLDMAAALAALTAPLAPHIDTLSPTGVEAFHGATITVTGSGLSTATGVAIDGAPAAAFAVVDDHTLHVTTPDAGVLGPATLTVNGPGGTSASANFMWIETAPPRLDVPAVVQGGAPLAWTFGGGSQHVWSLLIAPDDTVFPWKGWQLLQHFVLVTSGGLDSRGLGSLQVSVPASAAGIAFRSQIVTFHGGLSGVSNVTITAITP